MDERSVEDVGHCLESPVRMPVGAFCLERLPDNGTHLVHVDERIEIGLRNSAEGPADGESLALEPFECGGDAADLAGVAGRKGEGMEGGGVGGDCGHGGLRCVCRLSICATPAGPILLRPQSIAALRHQIG